MAGGGGDPWGELAVAAVPVLVLLRLELLDRRAERLRRTILATAKAAEAQAALAAERRLNPR